MSNGWDEHGNGTPRTSHLSSPTTATLSPTWRPPKSPLPPHRLAKLANALGVSTPIPASRSPTSYLSRSFSESASPIDQLRRSPTPSTVGSSMGFNSYSPPTSKFLLHVIPPMHLPHDTDSPDDSNPPPPNAPGYHTQFRRGTLVPVHSTLQAQLGAIAKEYALPSAVGLVLYLVTSSPQSPSPQDMDMGEPGPRLSEDIWKHLWNRVLRTEQRDDMLMPSLSSRSTTPHTPYTPNLLGFGPAARSTPFLPQENAGNLRPFFSSSGESPLPHAPQPTYPITTSPSTPSSISDIRSDNKSAPPSSSSVSQSEPDTPDTSIEGSGLRADFLDLPGLNSPSLIPILAKIEFDIDRRKAAWYEPWMRSRKVNHAKRTDSRKGSKSQETDGPDEPRQHVPIELLTGKKNKSDPFGLSPVELEVEENGYAQLSESPEEVDSESDSETEEFMEDMTAKVSSLSGGKDPLDDVFGTDADTWADLHAENIGPRRHSNPNVVDLALTAEELSGLPNPTHLDEDGKSTKEEEEVLEMLDLMGKPHLAMSVPSPAKNKRSSSPTSMSGRKVPPPLVLKPKDKSGTTVLLSQRSPLPATDSPRLAYLGESSDHNGSDGDGDREFEEYTRIRSPTESDKSEKRGGAVFDDLDLGLDPTEDFDDDDPNDRRRSQLIMRAQLDEIERTMAQLSPRILKTDLEEEQNFSFHSATLSPSSPGKLNLSPGGLRNSDILPPPSPRLPRHPDPPENPMHFAGQTWPAVPFSMIKDKEGSASTTNPNAPPSPPRLAVNGVTTSAPRSYQPIQTPAAGSSESERRKKMEEDEEILQPPLLSTRLQVQGSSIESPIIPLSPDPFGRHPSTEQPQSFHMSGADWDTVTIGKGVQAAKAEPELEPPVKSRARSGTTSRFSTDSINGEEPPSTKTQNRGTLMSVKSIKKLWRKSNNKSTSSSQSAVPAPTSSGRTSPMVPQRPERPSQEQLDLPDVPNMPPANFGRVSPQQMAPPVPRPSQDQMYQGRPSMDQQRMPPPPANFGRLSPQTIPPRTDSMHGGHRPSLEQQNMLPPPRPSLDQLGPPGQPQHVHQLSVPSYPGRNPNLAPIITPHMQASRAASNLDRLHFDQESPYPIRRSPPVKQSPRPPSPPPLPIIPEQDKPVARKSILKWKSAASVDHSIPDSEPQPRSSFERPAVNGSSSRGRRPSVINFGSTRASVTSPDLPPSPQIPSQYINSNMKNGLEHRQSQRSRLTTSSTDSSYSPPQRKASIQSQSSLGAHSSSPPRSRTSSRDSRDSRPSFDASQFEFVSPKAGTLSYPYNGLDHQ
ncbi:hypothetical protein GALMADRAFT_234637 [Galerina marginata CBS 339.88]|uniref:Uncharacterized protein n=1 Tax=Galerina marginata (strain CBS 339.88) TaxID=685588 RepID=A0A067U044_GALM3|nr:hypothetical protein GALMADRAFT_234637 [Galerina marginata CBS 339.88]